MKKVLHVWRYYGTRTQSWLYRMLRAMQRHTPWLLLQRHWPLPTEEGEFPWPHERLVFFPHRHFPVRLASKLVPALRSGTVNVLGTLDVRFIRNLCRNSGFGLIHIHFGWTACTFLTPRPNLGVPVLVSLYGKDLFVRPGGYGQRLQRLLRQPDLHFHVTSQALAHTALELGARSERVTVIPVGVDLSPFPSPAEVEALHAQTRRSATLKLVSVGRLIECRAQDRLAEVGRMLSDKDIRFIWTIIGDGPLRPVLERRISDLNLTESFVLLGSQPFD
ncbi:MAG: glycosyltransferase, partial [Kiritimatiellae bacterium]|nr:glycosyltransferase [Kiritimatiellia bacterium]